jgi:hypothetical protein
LLFLEKTIRIDPSEGLDKRGFPVVDMPGGPDDALLCHDYDFTYEGASILARP